EADHVIAFLTLSGPDGAAQGHDGQAREAKVVPPMAEGARRQAKEVGRVGPVPAGGLQVEPGLDDVTAGRLFLQAMESLPGKAAPRRPFAPRLASIMMTEIAHDFGLPRG